MNLSASLSIINCPMCGEAVGVAGIKISTDPELNITRYENYRTKIQLSKDPATGKIKAERVKEE